MTTSVDTLIANQKEYAANLLTAATAQLDRMRADIDNVGFTAFSFNGTNLPDAPDLPDPLVAPTLSPVNLELPIEPTATLEFQDISAIEVGTAPTLTAVAPTIVLPSLPAQLAEFTDQLPAIRTEFQFPEIPTELDSPLPAAPTMGAYVTPTAPTIALPSFDAVVPVDDLTAPADLAAQFNGAYRDAYPGFVASLEAQMDSLLTRYNPQFHTQMARIEAQLATYLEGGTGLAPAVEDAIYERAKDKEIAEARRTSRAAYANAAARGFTIPDGAVFSQDARARQAASDNLARSANEIAIKQAEVEQANLQFAVTTSAGLRQAMLSAALSYHGQLVQVNGQALDYARAMLGATVEVYNLAVKAFGARLDAYKAEALAYDTRLKAAMSHITLYQAEVDALATLVNVDRAKVELYRGRIDALKSLADVYRSRIDVVVQQSNLERLKLDAFRSKAEAFGTLVQAKKAEYDAFTAAINGNEAMVRVYSAQVDAFSAEQGGYKTKIEAQAEVVRAQAATNEARATQYKAVFDAYQTIAQVRGSKAETELKVQQAELNAFDSQVRASIATSQLQTTVYQAQANIILQNAKLEVETLISSAQLHLERLKSTAAYGVAGSNVYQGLLGATMSGMNTLVSQSQSE